MAHRSIEILIGRLITDEAFRSAFLLDPMEVLSEFADCGHDLTGLEIAALMATPAGLWERAAEQIDP